MLTKHGWIIAAMLIVAAFWGGFTVGNNLGCNTKQAELDNQYNQGFIAGAEDMYRLTKD
jgi:hypothetical protein